MKGKVLRTFIKRGYLIKRHCSIFCYPSKLLFEMYNAILDAIEKVYISLNSANNNFIISTIHSLAYTKTNMSRVSGGIREPYDECDVSNHILVFTLSLCCFRCASFPFMGVEFYGVNIII